MRECISVHIGQAGLLGVEELTVCSCAYLIDDRGLEVYEYGARHVFARSGLAEEGVERVVTSSDGLVRRHLAIGLDSVFQTVQFPATIADLGSGLADVYGDALTHNDAVKMLGRRSGR